MEPGPWISYFQKPFTKNKPENLVAEQEIVPPQYLEELGRDFTIQQPTENIRKVNKQSYGYDEIQVKGGKEKI